jgi:hypothetical protein
MNARVPAPKPAHEAMPEKLRWRAEIEQRGFVRIA